MATAIGKLAVILSANAQALQDGLSKAQGSITAFADKAAKTFSKAMKIGTIGGLAGGGAFGEMITGGFDRIKELNRQAKIFGISVESLSTLQATAGAGADALQGGLMRLSRELGSVREGSAEAALHFEVLGLNAQQLSEMPLDRAFLKIADKVKGLSSQADRAALAFHLFGRRGQELLPMLEKGSSGIKQHAAELAKMGVVVGGADAERVMAAAKAMKGLKQLAEGVGNDLAVGFSGFLEVVANAVGIAGGKFTDLMQKVKDGWKTMGATFGAQILNFRQATGISIPGMMERVLGGLPEWKEAAKQSGKGVSAAGNKFFVETQKQLKDESLKIGKTEDEITMAKAKQLGLNAKMLAQLDAMLKKNAALKALAELKVAEKSLEDQVRYFGMDDLARKRAELIKKGVTGGELRKFDELAAKLKDLEKGAAGKELAKSLATPAEALSDELDRLKDLFETGSIDADIYGRALNKAFEKAESAMGGAKDFFGVEALQAGSASAISAINRFRFGQRETEAQRQLRIAEQALEQQKVIAQRAKEQVDAIKNVKLDVKVARF